MSEEIKKMIEKKNETFSDTDDKGRLLTIRKPGALAQYRLVAMLGRAADSDRYMQMVSPLLFLCGIDDDMSVGFSTLKEMEFLIQKLGDEGLQKLQEMIAKNFFESDPAEDKNNIKK